MKALSLYQPYASLIAHGLKRYETRPWQTQYRGTVAIASCKGGFIAGVSRIGGLPSNLFPKAMPRGVIVAVAQLVDILPAAEAKRRMLAGLRDMLAVAPSDYELVLGNYAVGRHAWAFDDIRLLNEPIPCTGQQCLWSVPNDLIARIEAQHVVDK